MKDFKGHHPIGIVRTCNGSGMSVTAQRRVLTINGVENIFRLGTDNTVDDVMVTFHRKLKDGSTWPHVLVIPFPAVIGNDRREIFKSLLGLGQSLYDLELDRFITLNEGTADSILYEERCHKQRADYARTKVKNPGRKRTFIDRYDAAKEWCDPQKASINNDDIAEEYGVTGAQLVNVFGGRKECIAAGKPIKEGWNT